MLNDIHCFQRIASVGNNSLRQEHQTRTGGVAQWSHNPLKKGCETVEMEKEEDAKECTTFGDDNVTEVMSGEKFKFSVGDLKFCRV